VELTSHPAGTFCFPELGGQSERPVAGLTGIREDWGAVAPRWQVYSAVGDCGRAARQAVTLGGHLITGRKDVPDVGRFAVLSEPHQAVFAVFEAPSAP
jgi:predicted enzyme related to lactoylglutathione lyase